MLKRYESKPILVCLGLLQKLPTVLTHQMKFLCTNSDFRSVVVIKLKSIFLHFNIEMAEFLPRCYRLFFFFGTEHSNTEDNCHDVCHHRFYVDNDEELEDDVNISPHTHPLSNM